MGTQGGAGPRLLSCPAVAVLPPGGYHRRMPKAPFHLALGALCAVAPPRAQDAKVLFLTHSAGFEHPVVKRARAKLALAERELQRAARGQFEVVCTQDCAALQPRNLANYRAVVLYTSGELPVQDETREGLLQWIRQGGAFAGVHSATDTFQGWPLYREMIGGSFDGHPWHQTVGLLVEDRTHPATLALGEGWRITDEIYQFKGFSRDRVHVLLRLDPSTVAIEKGKRADNDYAIAWCRDYGKGRVFYTALGHRPAVWKDKAFQRHLVAGIRWAIHDEEFLGRPPRNATVLFDGKDFGHWRAQAGGEIRWKIIDGAMQVEPGTGSILTKQRYQSCRLHLEFRIARRPESNGNSGVYLQRRYEVQILDSSAKEKLGKSDCGALYRQRAPDVRVLRRPGEWQSYDIMFRAARFDERGDKVRNARITALQNGIVIHHDVELTNKTGAGQAEGPAAGAVLLQEHGSRVRFRNVWVVPWSDA